MWKSRSEIEHEISNLSEINNLKRIWALSIFWKNAVYPENYEADPAWESLITLTQEGKERIKKIEKDQSYFSKANFHLALFGYFFHHELFIDFQATDAKSIENLLQKEIFESRIHFPCRFGRLLYDKFNDLHSSERTDHLLAKDVQLLLNETPQGVYQIGHTLIGPLGILKSKESRWIPPSLRLPLWHCSDTGCGAIHRVQFLPPDIPLTKAYHEISDAFKELLGPRSEWLSELNSLFLNSKQEEGRFFFDLPAVIGDCIIDKERKELLSYVLAGSQSAIIRDALSSPPRKKKEAFGSPDEIALKQTPEIQLQLLLLLNDLELVNAIDNCVLNGKIRLALGEKRRPFQQPPKSTRDTPSELSVFGIRSVYPNSIVNLVNAIWTAYQDAGIMSELEWRLKGCANRNHREALVSFIRERGPDAAISELVLTTSSVTRIICDKYNFSLDNPAKSPNADILLWKIGFDPLQFNDIIERLRRHIKEFNETVISVSPIRTEEDRELVRRSGVNLFVILEQFIDRIVCYNIWLLASDHFVDTRFDFEIKSARNSVAKTLGSKISTSDGVEVNWLADGQNALGTLMIYLRKSIEWMKSLADINRDDILRPTDELPHYSESTTLRFPFRHKELWADSDPTALHQYIEGFSNVTKFFEQANLSYIRNGLDHYREVDDFPNDDKILGCVARLQQAIEIADVNRYFPKIYWLYSKYTDFFGHVQYELKDYAERSSVIYGPPLVSGIRTISYNYPLLIAPGNLLGDPNESLCFRYREMNEYSIYWKGYPRRRKIKTKDEISEDSSS